MDYANEKGDYCIRKITNFEAKDIIEIGGEVKVRRYDIKLIGTQLVFENDSLIQ